MANILFIVKYKDPSIGGVERVTYELYKALNHMSHSCYLAYYREKDKTDKTNFFFDEDINGSDLIKLITPYLEKNNIQVIINQVLVSDGIIELCRHLKTRTNIKVINCHHNQPDFPKYWKMPLRYKITEALYKIRKGYPSYAVPYRALYDNSHKFILLSESFIPIAKRCFGLKDGSRLYAISNPISAINEDGIIPFEKKKKQFLIVSRLYEHQKNITSALRIWNKFEQINKDYSLIIAGTGPDEMMLKEYSQQLGNQRVSFIGHQSDPDSLYHESRFFMMTSTYEGFGMTLIEAQRYGCIPFVFDSYLSLHDIITNNVNGYIIKNRDEKGYLKAMNRAIGNNDISSISKNAIANISRFDVNKIAKKWDSLIDELTNH